MTLEIWLAYVVTCLILVAIPGPTVIIVVSYALGRGKQSAWFTVPGVGLGDLTAMTVALLGAGAILAASSQAFTLLKLFGAAYLVWLGVRMWRDRPSLDELQAKRGQESNWSLFWNAYVVTTFNPKSIVFFVAFVPQFINPSQPTFLQFSILEITFVVIAVAAAAIWALMAAGLRKTIKNDSGLAILNKTGAGFLIGAGVLSAATGRS